MNTEAMNYQEGQYLDHTPAAALTAGQIVEAGGRAGMASTAIAASAKGAAQVKGVIKVVAAAVDGLKGDVVGWDEDGDPYGGTAGTGALTTNLVDADFVLGSLVADLAAADGVAYVAMNEYGIDDPVIPGKTCEFMDDFFCFDDGDDWIDTVSDAGTIEVTDGANGILSIASGATDNNESYVSSKAELALFQADKKAIFEARVKLTEANVNDANIIIGLSDTVAADSLLDDGAGPMASFDGAVFFKVDGGTVWQARTSNAATPASDTSAGAFTSGAWHTLRIVFDPGAGTTGTVKFYVNGVLGASLSITLAGLAEMHILLGVKAGDANAETLLVDYARLIQDR